MRAVENIRFNRPKGEKQPKVFPEIPRVNLNNLMKKVKEEENKTKRNNLAVSLAAVSAVAIFGVILTL